MHLDRTQMLSLCAYCGSRAAAPERGDGVQVLTATPHRCPLCEASSLHDGRIERFPVHYCRQCEGLLIRLNLFLPLIEYLRELRDRPAEHQSPRGSHDADRALPCPLCRSKMLNYVYGGGGNVHLDSCRTCDVIWLDHQELRRIVLAPDPRPTFAGTDILEA